MKFRADMQHRVADEVGNLYETSSKTDRKYAPGGQLLQKGHWSYRYDACELYNLLTMHLDAAFASNKATKYSGMPGGATC